MSLGSRFRPKPKNLGAALFQRRHRCGLGRTRSEAMTTPGREKLRGRREEQKVRALAAIEPCFSRLNSNGGRGLDRCARRKRKSKTAIRGGEKSDERKVPGRAAIGSRRFRRAGVGAWRRQHRSRPMHHEDRAGHDDLHRLSTTEIARAVLRRHSRRRPHHHRARRPAGRIARHGAGNPHPAQCRPKG